MKKFLSGALFIATIASAADYAFEQGMKIGIEQGAPVVGHAIDRIYGTIFGEDSLAHYNEEDIHALAGSALFGRIIKNSYYLQNESIDPAIEQRAKDMIEADIETTKKLKDLGMTFKDIINDTSFANVQYRNVVLSYCPECLRLYDEVANGVPVDSYWISIQIFKGDSIAKSLSTIIEAPKFRSEQAYLDLNSTNRNRFLASIGYNANTEIDTGAVDAGAEDRFYGIASDGQVGFRYGFSDIDNSFTLSTKLCTGAVCPSGSDKTLVGATGLIGEEYSYVLDFYKMGVEILKTE